MMIIMVIISNNDKLQIVSSSSIRLLIHTMIWLTVSELYQAIWPMLIRRTLDSSSLHQIHRQQVHHHLLLAAR